MRLRSLFSTLLLSFSASVACSKALVSVPTGPAPARVPPIAVDYPPPPAKIEEIQIARDSRANCMWLDGYWDFTGKHWEWQAGRPVIPEPGCTYAGPKLAWVGESLAFYRPVWSADASASPPPKSCAPSLCQAPR